MSRWPLQVSYWTLGGGNNAVPPARVFAAARDAGFEGVELAFEASGVLCPETPEPEVRSFRAEADRLGLRLDTLATGFYWKNSFGDPDPAVRGNAIEFSRSYLRAASWLGTRAVLVIPGVVAVPWNEPVRAVARYDEVWDRATRALWRLLPLAEKYEVAIGLENVWNWFLSDPAAMRSFVDQFASPWLGTYLDAGNCLVNGFPEQWVALLGHRVKAVHAKAFTRHDGGGGLSGFGRDFARCDADWTAVAEALRETGYQGPITAEMFAENAGGDPVEEGLPLARDTAAKMRKAFGPE